MSEGPQEIKCVNWKEIFGCSHIFKSFRMAIHLSKLLLGLAAVMLIYIGGYVLDGVWCVANQRVPQDAITAYYQRPAGYDAAYQGWQGKRVARATALLIQAEKEESNPGTGSYAVILEKQAYAPSSPFDHEGFRMAFNKQRLSATTQPQEDMEKVPNLVRDNWESGLELARKRLEQAADKVEKLIDNAVEVAVLGINANADLAPDAKEEALANVKTDARKARYALTRYRVANDQAAKAVTGTGVFNEFLGHELACLANATTALTALNLTEGASRFNQDAPRAVFADGQGGALYWTMMACTGVKWLISRHVFFAVILGLWSLAVWALLGGAIHRIAALQAAREEKISIRQSLQFSMSKFFSFFTAPLIPLALILVFCGLLSLGGAIGNIPVVGPIILGVLFGLALILGLIIAFLAVGLVAGGGLMYPTIAVEGSDSFDAISRSFSYVFARPWRSAMYGLIALAHGSACYIFVRAFAFVALKATHMAVKFSILTGGTMGEGASDRMDVLWKAPVFDAFHAPLNWAAMDGWGDRTGAAMLFFWVHIVIGLVGAFILTYFASSTTVIYYLLRRKVDATDLDDVYIEEDVDEMPEIDPEPGEDGEDSAEGGNEQESHQQDT